jgi:nitrite reductase/ring-hydroxylating ferredoxin subunit
VVCHVEELPPGSRKVVAAGPFGIGVFNVKGSYHALTNYCPHRGGPLCLGEITGTTEELPDHSVTWTQDGEVLRCPWHNWEFVIETGLTVSQPVKRVKTYPVRVEGDLIVLELPDRGAEKSA